MTPPVTGIILAGGRSRRLGVDKRSLNLSNHGTQLLSTIERLAQVADEIFVAGDPPEEMPSSVSVVGDVAAGTGPLGGLVAGLRAARQQHAIVLACDLPFLNLALLRVMSDLPRTYDLLVPRRADGTFEMLHAIYRCAVGEHVHGYLASGQRRLSGLPAILESAGFVVETLEETWLRHYDPSLRSFFNLNTPADLEQARAELQVDLTG